MQITIIEKQEWGGEKYEGKKGFGYTGFTKGGDPIRFSSSFDHTVYEDAIGFEQNRSEEIKLKTKIWENLETGKNQIKYTEIGSEFE